MLRKNALLSLLLFIALIFTSACGSSGSGNCDFFGYPNTNTENPQPTPETKTITLSKYKFTLDVGNTDKVIAYVNGEDKTNEVKYTPIKEEFKKDTVATVEKGLITALKAGTEIFQVSYPEAESVTFTVTANDPTLPNLEVSKTEINYIIGDDTKDIENIIVMLNGEDVTNKTTFTSSNENVATVDENGKITFIAEGETEIIAHLDGANDKIITVKVNLPELELSKSETTIELGDTEDITVKLRGKDETKNATFTSSDESVVTVDENGKITTLKEGNAVITVSLEGAKDGQINVTVPHKSPVVSKKDFKIMLGNTDKLPNVTLRGEDVTSTCQFKSNNENIVTIDEDGNIKGVGVGDTTITTECNGDKITLNINVYNTLTTTATNTNGDSVEINTKVLSEEEADEMKVILRDTGMIGNENAVQNIVQIDQINNIDDVTINVDAEDGTQVAVISKEENSNTINYVSTETVQDGQITISNVSDKNIYEVATTNENGETEMVLTTAGFYKDDELIASWEECNSWLNKWWERDSGGKDLMSAHNELLQATKLIFPEDGTVTHIGNILFRECGYNIPGSPHYGNCLGSNLNTIVLPNSLQECTLGTPFLSGTFLYLTNVNIRVDNPFFESIDGVIYSEDLKTLILVPTNKIGFSVLNSVETISNRAMEFHQGQSVGAEGSESEVILPNSIRKIETHVWAQCPNLLWLELPNGVTTIQPLTCGSTGNNLRGIFIPNTVTQILAGDATSGNTTDLNDNCGTVYYESNGVTREWFRENCEN